MVEIAYAGRRSAVLTPSSLACLSGVCTINLTAGCAHGCLYCYTRGCSAYPGPNRIVVYKNIVERLEKELARKRTRPATVYFSPSSDLFQPIPEVSNLAYDVLAFLLARGIHVAFLTKGAIPSRHMSLLKAHSSMAHAQVGILSTSRRVRDVFEPLSALPEERLRQIEELVVAGIPVQARLDPILPGVTDDERTFDELCAALRERGVRELAASVLFLRPAVRSALEAGLSGAERSLLREFHAAKRLSIHAENSSVLALPPEVRTTILARLEQAAQRHGLTVRVCGCKNPDLTHASCGIAGMNGEAPAHEQMELFKQRGIDHD